MLSNLSSQMHSQSNIDEQGNLFDYTIDVDSINDQLDTDEKELEDERNDINSKTKTVLIQEINENEMESDILNDIIQQALTGITISHNIPDDGDDKLNINSSNGFLMVQNSLRYGVDNKQKYQRATKSYLNYKYKKLKRIENFNMKIKVISVKVIYILGKKALQLLFTSTIAPWMMGFLINPSIFFNINKMDGIMYILEVSGLIPARLIYQFKNAITSVKGEFSTFIKSEFTKGDLPDGVKAFLNNSSSKQIPKEIMKLWNSYVNTSKEGNILTDAISSIGSTEILNESDVRQDNAADLFEKYLKNLTASNYSDFTIQKIFEPIQSMLGQHTNINKLDFLRQVLVKNGGKLSIYHTSTEVFNRLFQTKFPAAAAGKRQSLKQFGTILTDLGNYNTSYLGILQNTASLGSELTNIIPDISNLSSKDASVSEGATKDYFKLEAQNTLQSAIHSPQLVKLLNGWFSEGSLSIFGSENKALLGIIDPKILNWVGLDFGTISTGLLGTLSNSMFYVNSQKPEYDKKKKQKEEFERKFQRRIELYDKGKDYKKVSEIMEDEFNLSGDKLQSHTYKKLRRIFKGYKKDIAQASALIIGTLATFEFTSILSSVILNSLSTGDPHKSAEIFSTFATMLVGWDEHGEMVKYFTAIFSCGVGELTKFLRNVIMTFGAAAPFAAVSAAVGGITCVGKKTGSLALKDIMAKIAGPAEPVILGIRKSEIINWMQNLIGMIQTELSNIISDTTHFIKQYCNDLPNKNSMFKVLFNHRASKLILNLTPTIFDFMSKAILNTTASKAYRDITQTVYSLSFRDMLEHLTEKKFINMITQINAKLPSIMKYIYQTKSMTAPQVSAAIMGTYDKIELRYTNLEDSLYGARAFNKTEQQPAPEGGYHTIISWICKAVTLGTFEDYEKVRTDIYNKSIPGASTDKIVGVDVIEQKAWTTGDSSEIETNTLNWLILDFYNNQLNNQNLPPEYRSKLEGDKIKFMNNPDQSYENLELFKTDAYKNDFLNFLQQVQSKVSPTSYHSGFLKELLQIGDGNKVALFSTVQSQKINFDKDITRVDSKNKYEDQKFKIKYNTLLDNKTHINIPDSFIVGPANKEKTNICSWDKFNQEDKTRVSDLIHFLRDIRNHNSRHPDAGQKTMHINAGKCSKESIKLLLIKGGLDNEWLDNANLQFDTHSSDADNVYTFEHKTNSRDGLLSFSPMQIAKFIYPTGSEIDLSKTNLFFQSETLQFKDKWGNVQTRGSHISVELNDLLDNMYLKEATDALRVDDLESDLQQLIHKLENSNDEYTKQELQKILTSLSMNSHKLQSSMARTVDLSTSALKHEWVGPYSHLMLEKESGDKLKDTIQTPELSTNEDQISSNLIKYLTDNNSNNLNKIWINLYGSKQEIDIGDDVSVNLDLGLVDGKIVNISGNTYDIKLASGTIKKGIERAKIRSNIPQIIMPDKSQLNIFTMLPILFNPKTIKYLCNKENSQLLAPDNTKQNTTKHLDDLTTIINNDSSTYCSLNNNISQNQLNMHDNISTYIFKKYITKILGGKKQIEWIDNETDFICKSLSKIPVEKKEEYINTYISKLKPNFNSNISCKNVDSLPDKIYLYGGKDLRFRKNSIDYIKYNTPTGINSYQIGFLNNLIQSNYEYTTKNWNDGYYNLLLRTFGIENYLEDYPSNTYGCLYTKLFKSENTKLVGSLCGPTLPIERPPEDPKKLLAWAKNNRSDSWKNSANEAVDFLIPDGQPIGRRAGSHSQSQQEKELRKKYIESVHAFESASTDSNIKDAFDNVNSTLREIFALYFPGQDNQHFDKFHSSLQKLRNNEDRFEQEKKLTIENLQHLSNRYNPELEKSQYPQTGNTGLMVNLFNKLIGSISSSPSPATTGQAPSHAPGMPAEMQRPQAEQRVNAGQKTQELTGEGQKSELTQRETQKVEEQLAEDIDQAVGQAQSLDEGLANSEAEKLKESLKSMFSFIGDTANMLRQLGSHLKNKSANVISKIETAEDEIGQLTDEATINSKCAAYSTLWSPGGGVTGDHIIFHGNALRQDSDPELARAFIKEKCVNQSIGMKTLDTMGSLKKGVITAKWGIILKDIGELYVKWGSWLAVVGVGVVAVGIAAAFAGALPLVALCLAAGTTITGSVVWLSSRGGQLGGAAASCLGGNCELTKHISESNTLYKTKFLYDNIFKKTLTLETIDPETIFTFKNVDYKKSDLREEGGAFYLEKGGFKIPDLNKQSNVFVEDDSNKEYDITEIINGENFKKNDQEHLNLKRLLLVQLYTLVGSKEFEELASREKLSLAGDKMGNHKINNINPLVNKTIQKLWKVRDIERLRSRNTDSSLNSVKPSSDQLDNIDTVLKLRNYKFYGDKGSLWLDAGQSLRGLQNMNGEFDLKDLINKGTDLDLGIADNKTNLVMDKLIETSLYNPGTRNLIYGPNSVQNLILQKIAPISSKQPSDGAPTEADTDSAFAQFREINNKMEQIKPISDMIFSNFIDRQDAGLTAMKDNIMTKLRQIPGIESWLGNIPPTIVKEYGETNDNLKLFMCNEFYNKLNNNKQLSSSAFNLSSIMPDLSKDFLHLCKDIPPQIDSQPPPPPPPPPPFLNVNQESILKNIYRNHSIDHNEFIALLKDADLTLHTELEQYMGDMRTISDEDKIHLAIFHFKWDHNSINTLNDILKDKPGIETILPPESAADTISIKEYCRQEDALGNICEEWDEKEQQIKLKLLDLGNGVRRNRALVEKILNSHSPGELRINQQKTGDDTPATVQTVIFTPKETDRFFIVRPELGGIEENIVVIDREFNTEFKNKLFEGIELNNQSPWDPDKEHLLARLSEDINYSDFDPKQWITQNKRLFRDKKKMIPFIYKYLIFASKNLKYHTLFNSPNPSEQFTNAPPCDQSCWDEVRDFAFNAEQKLNYRSPHEPRYPEQSEVRYAYKTLKLSTIPIDKLLVDQTIQIDNDVAYSDDQLVDEKYKKQVKKSGFFMFHNQNKHVTSDLQFKHVYDDAALLKPHVNVDPEEIAYPPMLITSLKDNTNQPWDWPKQIDKYIRLDIKTNCQPSTDPGQEEFSGEQIVKTEDCEVWGYEPQEGGGWGDWFREGANKLKKKVKNKMEETEKKMREKYHDEKWVCKKYKSETKMHVPDSVQNLLHKKLDQNLDKTDIGSPILWVHKDLVDHLSSLGEIEEDGGKTKICFSSTITDMDWTKFISPLRKHLNKDTIKVSKLHI